MPCAFERQRDVRACLLRVQRLSSAQLYERLTDCYARSDSGVRMLRRDLERLVQSGEVCCQRQKGQRALLYSLRPAVMEPFDLSHDLSCIQSYFSAIPTLITGEGDPLSLVTVLYDLLSDLNDDHRYPFELLPGGEPGGLRAFKPEHLKTVLEAWTHGRAVQFSYRNRAGKTSTPVFHVQKLRLSGNALFMLGVRDEDLEHATTLRTYAMDNVSKIHFTDIQWIRRSDLQPESAPLCQLHLRVGGYVADYLESNPLSENQSIQIDPEHAGHSLVEASVPSNGDLLRRLLGWGPNAEVLAPPEWRHRLASQIAKMARLYGYPIPSPDQPRI